ncbi:MAG: ligase, partial [Burkholderiaceae bacterium]|nr:ligase [Burkholderiaceae bacterium]
GGGAVLAGPWMVSASIALPTGHPLLGETLAGSYRWLGEVHAGALGQMGVPARALPPQEIAGANAALRIRSVGWACFGALSPWEVVAADGRKLVGLAQRRKQAGVLLVAGTLVGATDWGLLCEVMGHPEDEAVLRRRTVAAAELAGGPIAPEAFATVLTRLLDSALGSSVPSPAIPLASRRAS